MVTDKMTQSNLDLSFDIFRSIFLPDNYFPILGGCICEIMKKTQRAIQSECFGYILLTCKRIVQE